MAQRFEIPEWIVSALGVERTQRLAREAIRDLKAAGIGFAQGRQIVIDLLEIEADAEQRARFCGAF
jgi:hypothetical protein